MAEHETTAPWLLPYPDPTGKVKEGGTDFKELAERLTTIFKERLTTLTEHGGSFTAASGELIKCTAAITVTLPAATVNRTIGVVANSNIIKVGAGAALIYWGSLEGVTPVTIRGYQTVVLHADGTNWFVVAEAGAVSPSSVGTYGATTARAFNTEYEPSATRPTWVALKTVTGGTASTTGSFICPPATKFKISKQNESPTNVTIGGVIVAAMSWIAGEPTSVNSTYLPL